jgi:hypothetical protein
MGHKRNTVWGYGHAGYWRPLAAVSRRNQRTVSGPTLVKVLLMSSSSLAVS